VTAAVPAILSLGSNLGDRLRTLVEATSEIGALDGVDLLAQSSTFETPALTPDGVDASAPAYLNLAVEVATRLAPETLLAELNRIEQEHGRTRDVHWGDRTLDIDIVTMGGLELATESLILPHPQARYRSFVLVPWLEIDPAAELPGVGPIGRLPAAHEVVARYRAEADS
jgi:2-amino-4-hydroxy-6-hydroxymethyldihydropteridine diphosphokinase